MINVIYNPNGIEGLAVIEPQIYCDERGCFFETYNLNGYNDAGLNCSFVQDNQCKSKKGVLRGLHINRLNPQGKLVRVIEGSVFDVAVDLRPQSITYGKNYGIILSSENVLQFYMPPGFAHGYLVLSDYAVFSYKVTDYYCPEGEVGIIWNDKMLGIDWPVKEVGGVNNIILNNRDRNNASFFKYTQSIKCQ